MTLSSHKAKVLEGPLGKVHVTILLNNLYPRLMCSEWLVGRLNNQVLLYEQF